jgi:uncharacterized protein (TIGR03067 family)
MMSSSTLVVHHSSLITHHSSLITSITPYRGGIGQATVKKSAVPFPGSGIPYHGILGISSHTKGGTIMKARAIVLATVMFIVAGFSWAGGAGKGAKSLQGTWSAVKDDKKIELTFKGDKFIAAIGEETYKGSFKIDPGKKPKTIDMSVKEGKKYEGQTSLGIYKIDGDKLTWCANEPGKDDRPKEFAEEQGGMKFMLIVLERKKKE